MGKALLDDILDCAEIVQQSATRIAYKMDAWEELDDITQEMWLEIVSNPGLRRSPPAAISRRLGTVGANWIVAQKNLGMVMESEPDAQPLSSALDRELIEWALPQLTQSHRTVIRSVLGQCNDITRSDINQSDIWFSETDLKAAFRELSKVVSIYQA